MVTREQLRELLGHRPFQPFAVKLTNGDVVEIVRTAQAIATPQLFIVGTSNNRFRWIQLDRIDGIEPLDAKRAAS